MPVRITSFDTASPGDTAELSFRLAGYAPHRIRRLALLVKTEGSADVNDFSRELASWRAREAVLAHGGPKLLDRTVFLHSTGAEGAMTPFGYLLVDLLEEGRGEGPGQDPDGGPDEAAAVRPAAGESAAAAAAAEAPGRKAAGGGTLALGVGRSRTIRGGEIGSARHVGLAEQAVAEAAADAGLAPADVALAVVKTPLTGHDEPVRVTSAEAKAVGALGAALALGEVARADVVPAAFGRDLSLHSARTMVFSSSEAARVEVLVLGNRPGAGGDLRIVSGPLADVLDAPGIRRVLAAAGADLTPDGTVREPARVAALLIKVGHRHDGTLRGARTTVLTSQLDPDKHVRSVMSGVAGSVLGTGRLFISANSVHQAPDGGGLCAAITTAAPAPAATPAPAAGAAVDTAGGGADAVSAGAAPGAAVTGGTV
ncbi:ring-opening amidohydrolase [Actinacidiphila sp. ITFR-21]|uniref:ring-opening amidohydrolase n=1 Tax=Actinacidiphila sp. ITFR-21 TaxID=3075199 RepID=UPI00288AD029|nr:ring-opening amidohydrolase [Streptomyces sp. ITFR-21]WNI18803.1 ring-opening amidohydrolase [Streptomyces sp. ITFR-21]